MLLCARLQCADDDDDEKKIRRNGMNKREIKRNSMVHRSK